LRVSECSCKGTTSFIKLSLSCIDSASDAINCCMRLSQLREQLREYGISADVNLNGWREGSGGSVYAPGRRAALQSAYQAARFINPDLPATRAEYVRLRRENEKHRRQVDNDETEESRSPSEIDALTRLEGGNNAAPAPAPVPPAALSLPETRDPQALMEYFAAEMARKDAETAAAMARKDAEIASLRRKRDGGGGRDNGTSGISKRRRRGPAATRKKNTEEDIMVFDENCQPLVPRAASGSGAPPPEAEGDDENEMDVGALVEDMMDNPFEWHGVTKKLRNHVNFDSQAILNAFTFRGAVFAFSMEQSEKTLFEMILAGLASLVGRPCILVAGLKHPSTAELTAKMQQKLEQVFGVTTYFMSNAEKPYMKMIGDEEFKSAFLRGKRLVVMPAYAQHRTQFLNALNARNVLTLLDESDEVIKRTGWTESAKEARFVDIVGRPHEDTSRVTGVVLVSATHMSDMHVWTNHLKDVPQHSVFVDPAVLKARGFTTQDDMTLFSSRVTHIDAKPYRQHGVLSEGFKDLMADFKSCPGRRKLMMVASCPRVAAGESTLYTQARRILGEGDGEDEEDAEDLARDMDPHAIVLVHHSGKSAGLWRAPAEQGGQIVKKELKKRNAKGRVVNVGTAGEALSMLENWHCGGQRLPSPDGASTSSAAVSDTDRRL